MTITYDLKDDESEVLVTEEEIVNHQQGYKKDWLIAEIARLKLILEQFKPKDI